MPSRTIGITTEIQNALHDKWCYHQEDPHCGGGFDTAFIRSHGRVDRQTAAAVGWFKSCAPLAVRPFVQNLFIESLSQTEDWDEILLSMDGIVASGGNTLNQQAIWKAQEIDAVLRDAWDRGIVLGGASAGSLCWFEEGTPDSRPKALSIVQCLGFLPGSHSPHYDEEPGRRPLYQRLIASGDLMPGYACDNDAGIYFENTAVKRVVSASVGAKAYFVDRVGDTAVETTLEPETIS